MAGNKLNEMVGMFIKGVRNMTAAATGSYSERNPEINRLEQDMFQHSESGFASDRRNLHGDYIKWSGDFRKAINKVGR